MRIDGNSRAKIDAANALRSLRERDVSGFDIPGNVVIVGLIQLRVRVQENGSIRTLGDFGEATKLAEIERGFERERPIAFGIFQNARGFDIRLAEADPKAGDGYGVIRDESVGGQIDFPGHIAPVNGERGAGKVLDIDHGHAAVHLCGEARALHVVDGSVDRNG